MTREEAIEILQNIAWSVGSVEREQIQTALDLAIETLSQPIVAKHFDIQSGYIYCSPQIAENVKVVVRCKDCKYKRLYDERLYDEGENKYYYCALEDRPNRNWSVDDTDYCSWGERREE